MGLAEVANNVFNDVFRPEKSKKNDLDIAPHESEESYGNIYRISKGFKKIPIVMYNIGHNLPNVVGTENIGMPHAFGSYMQQLRDKKIDSSNPEDVTYFQEMISSITTLYMPLVLAQILNKSNKENLLDGINIKVRFKHRETGEELFENPIEYEELISKEGSLTTAVKTVGGSMSLMKVIPNLHEYTPLLEVKGNLGLNINLIDVQRGGTLPSLMSRWIFDQLGCDSGIISSDAKRAHKEDGTDVDHINLLKPLGYKKSKFSKLISDSFVAPFDYNENPDIHILFDPMLATGKSARAVIEQYCIDHQCDYSDINIVGLFAGGYECFDELSELGVNIFTLAHDEADLNLKKYIQPGLGDAGDKLTGLNKIVNRLKLRQISRTISKNREGFKEIVDDYGLQLFGIHVENFYHIRQGLKQLGNYINQRLVQET